MFLGKKTSLFNMCLEKNTWLICGQDRIHCLDNILRENTILRCG